MHAFEDAIVKGFVDVRRLTDAAHPVDLVDAMFVWIGGEIDHDQLLAAFARLKALDAWLTEWDGSRRAQGRLKNLTSQLIGRFVVAATRATRAEYPGVTLGRFAGSVVVPPEIQAEIAVLKGIVAAFVMSTNARQPIYRRQRTILTDLATALLKSAPRQLDPGFAADWAAARTDAERKRVIVDQVASLTDQSAMSWHSRVRS